MSEQAPQMNHDGNPDYIEHHPNAVQDPAKAEEMAYASKADEERIVSETGYALEMLDIAQADQRDLVDAVAGRTDNVGFVVREAEEQHGKKLKSNGSTNDPEIFRTVRDGLTDAAERALMMDTPRIRERADKDAERAGKQYDIRTTAERLRSGRS